MEIKYNTKEESREAYKEYVKQHIAGVVKAFKLFGQQLCEYIAENRIWASKESWQNIYIKLHDNIIVNDHHDASKYSDIEFDAYAAKFYTSKEDLEEFTEEQIKENFDEAWKHHYSVNPHHPEYFEISIGPEGKKYCTMPNCFMVEMILDWISVSMVKKSDVLDWWNDPDHSGMKEKSEMLSENDIILIDTWLNKNKNSINFKES